MLSRQIIVPFLSLILTTTCISCTKVVKEEYPDGTIKSEITMKRGVKNGPTTYFYPNGTIELKMNYSDDLLEGMYEKYDLQGRKSEATEFSEGMKNGKSIQFYESGQKRIEATFVNDTLHGEYFEYHPNSQIKVKGSYFHGLYDGNWDYFESNGIRVGYALFDKGTGQQVALFYGSQMKKTIVPYENNQKHGQEIWYNKNGEVEKTLTYQHGKLTATQQK